MPAVIQMLDEGCPDEFRAEGVMVSGKQHGSQDPLTNKCLAVVVSEQCDSNLSTSQLLCVWSD